ncbi:MAG: HDOD domain-containing protein [Deltaproteobacteria bacterium]|nr:HDOD domain-containing protein [Deltaproteobacteria bacterium]
MTKVLSLIEQINEFVKQENFQLPVFNDIAMRILKMARHEDYDIREMSQLIYQDQVLVAEVLKAANSSFFGGLSAITTIKDAIVRLGARQVSDLVLIASERIQYSAMDKKLNTLLSKLWKHSVACAIGSQWLARRLSYHEKDNEAFIGGLLHDIGKLFLLRVIDTMKQSTELSFNISYDLSVELINSFHAEQGYKLLSQWNIPQIFCEIARGHHSEDFDQDNIPLLLVRLTNQACNKLGIGMTRDPSIVLVSAPEAAPLRIKEIVLAELEVMLEDTMQIAT